MVDPVSLKQQQQQRRLKRAAETDTPFGTTIKDLRQSYTTPGNAKPLKKPGNIQAGSTSRAFEEDQVKIRAKSAGLPYLNLYGFPARPEVLKILDESEAIDSEVIAFTQEGDDVWLGTVNPNNPKLEAVKKKIKKKKLKPIIYMISHSSFEKVRESYVEEKTIVEDEKGKISVRESQLKKFQETITSIKDLQKAIKNMSVTEIIELMVAGALQTSTSDIHLEPEEDKLRMRYRIDGVLQDVAELDPKIYPKLNSRLKIVSGLKINVKDRPQDGRYSIKVGGEEVDVRVSSLPSAYGEAIVMRLLGVGAISLQVKQLGLRGLSKEIIDRNLEKPNGMILTTGPTGSGKTTTLYAFVNHLNTPDIKIITLEDPIEYRLEGIEQTQIDKAHGFDFASGLRAILRQDPDVVLVGEIRDLETAEIATQASLTGHVVFSTLHTNDSAGVLPRMINMGVAPFVLAPAINAVIAQRLVRTICKECKKEYKPSEKEIAYVKNSLGPELFKDVPKNFTLFKGEGCETCHTTGYKGRLGIFEVFEIDNDMEKLILAKAAVGEIRDAAVKSGMMLMRQDGILKILEGISTLEEVRRVT